VEVLGAAIAIGSVFTFQKLNKLGNARNHSIASVCFRAFFFDWNIGLILYKIVSLTRHLPLLAKIEVVCS
jgi:hypothetical protein